MDWNAVGAIGEIVGAVAVVATIAYLAKETRTNTKAVVASAQRASSWGHADWSADSAKDPELARLAYKSTQPTLAEFDEFDWFKFQLFARSVVLRIQDTYLQRRLGFFDEDLAEVQLNHLRSLLEYPAWRTFWDDETKEGGGNYPQDFIDDINNRKSKHIGFSTLSALQNYG